MCRQPYWAQRIDARYQLCNDCFTPARLREYQRVQAQCQRAQTAGCTATLTLAQWLHTLAYFKQRCVYCEQPFEAMDHLIPLSAGGGTTATNCVPACATCNAQKGHALPNVTGMAERIPQVQHIVKDLFKELNKGE